MIVAPAVPVTVPVIVVMAIPVTVAPVASAAVPMAVPMTIVSTVAVAVAPSVPAPAAAGGDDVARPTLAIGQVGRGGPRPGAAVEALAAAVRAAAFEMRLRPPVEPRRLSGGRRRAKPGVAALRRLGRGVWWSGRGGGGGGLNRPLVMVAVLALLRQRRRARARQQQGRKGHRDLRLHHLAPRAEGPEGIRLSYAYSCSRA
jgi:hypothetical protein